MSFFIYDKSSSFKTHFFYSTLAQHGPKWWLFMKFLVYVGFWQDFVSSFTPLMLRHMTGGETTVVDNIYTWSLHFTSCSEFDRRRVWGTDFVILCLAMRIVITTILYVLAKHNFSKQSRLPEWVSSWRSFIIFYAPAPLSYPIVLSLALAIGSSWRENLEQFGYLNVIVGFAVWIGNFFENVFYLPLYSASPLVGNGWFPARMIPDYFYHIFELLNQAMILMVLTAPSDHVAYFFMAGSALYNLYMFLGLWDHPFGSFLESATLLSAMVMKIFVPIACCILIGLERPRAEELWLFFAGLGAFLVFILVFYFVLRKKASHPEKIKNVLLKFQWTAIGNKLDIRLCNELKEALTENPREDLMFGYIYAKLVHGDVDRDMYQRICGLSWMQSHWMNEMIIFELCKAYCESPDPFAVIPEMKRMDADVAEYNRLSNMFWTLMLGGKMKRAMATFGSLLEQKRKLRFQFEFFRSFYPTSDRISTFIMEFPHLAKNAPFHEQFKDRYSRYGRQLVAERGGGSVDGTGFSDCTSHGSYMKTIVMNIRRRTKRAVPFCYKLYLALAIIFLVLVLGLALYDYVQIFEVSQRINPLPGSMYYTLSILKMCSIVKTSLMNAMQCSPWIRYSTDELRKELGINLPEPDGIDFQTMTQTLDDLSNILDSIYFTILNVTNAVNRITNMDIRALVNCWYDKSVFMWRYSNNTILENVSMSMTSVILHQTRNIQHNWDSCQDYCNCPATDYFQEDKENFVAYTYDVSESLRDGCVRPIPYLDTLANGTVANITWLRKLKWDIGIVCFWLFSTIMIWGCHIYHCRMLVRYFRPQSHPNPSMHVERSEKTTKFEIQSQIIVYPLIVLFLCFCYVVQDCLIWNVVRSNYLAILGKYRLLGDLGRDTFSIISFVTMALSREMNLPISETIMNDIWKDVISATNLLTVAFKAAKRSPSLKDIVSGSLCDIDPSAVTFHDMFRCNPLVREVQHAAFMAWAVYQYIKNVTDNTPNNLVRLEHFYNVHLATHISNAADAMLNALIEPLKCYYYFVVELIVTVFFGIVIVIVFWAYYSLMVEYYQQLRDIFVVLDPLFIASNKCLMEFIMKIEEEKKVVEKPSCLFEILEASNAAIMVLADDLTIVALTKPVFAIFGYKQERLFGQFVDILIPKSRKETDKNDSNFYETLEQMKAGKITGTAMQWIVGRCSDDTVVYPRAKITRVDDSHTMYFVIEFKPASSEIHYENLALCYSEVFDNITRSSLPIPVVPEIRLSGETVIKQFKMGVLLAIYMHDTDFSIDFYDDFDVWKSTENFTVQWLSGRDQAVVIDSSCGNSLIMFLSEQESDIPIVNALTYAYEFANTCGSRIYGALVMCSNLELVVYHPEFVSQDSEKSIVMSVEPITNRFKMLRRIAPLFMPSTLLISDDVMELAPYIPATPLINDTGYDLHSLSIDLNDMRSEVPSY